MISRRVDNESGGISARAGSRWLTLFFFEESPIFLPRIRFRGRSSQALLLNKIAVVEMANGLEPQIESSFISFDDCSAAMKALCLPFTEPLFVKFWNRVRQQR